MKNESRIVELLSESLKKQDSQEQLLNVLTQGQAQLLLTVKDLVEVTKELAKNQNETNRRLTSIESKLIEISELRREIDEIKKYVGMK